MNLKKIVSTLLVGIIAVTATLAVATTASATTDVIYLDNYDMQTVKSGKPITFADDGNQHWARFTLQSEAVVTIAYQTGEGEAVSDYYAGGATIYSLSDKTTTKKQIAYYSGYDGTESGVSLKLAKGSYALHMNRGLADTFQYVITWTDKAATTNASAESLTVYIPMETGDRMVLSAAVKPKSAKVTYKSSDKEVLAVTSKGIVKAVGDGTAYVTVKAGKKTVKLYFEVTD